MKKKFILILILLIGLPCYYLATAQPREGEEIDKVIAVVGSDIIMLSELNAQIIILSQQDPTIKINDPEIRNRILDMLINEKLVTMKAIEDSVVVTDDEIKAQWEQQLNEYVRYYGSVSRIEAIYGMSIDRMQYEFRDEIRKHLLAQKKKMMKFGDIQVTQREVRDFYNEYLDSLPPVPEQVELYHIVKLIEPTSTTKEELYNLALKVRDSLINGGDFAKFAAVYSGDPGTQSEGGDLGWIKKGRLFPEYEKAALELLEGKISLPVETPFGYHLIKTLGSNRDSIHTKHILFKFSKSDVDRQHAIIFLDSLKQLVETGTPFEELARRFSDEAETKALGGLLGTFPLSNIPANLSEIIKNLTVGGISSPSLYGTDPKLSYHIIYKKRIIPAHKADLEQDYKQLEQLAKSNKQARLYQQWVEELRKQMYWEIK